MDPIPPQRVNHQLDVSFLFTKMNHQFTHPAFYLTHQFITYKLLQDFKVIYLISNYFLFLSKVLVTDSHRQRQQTLNDIKKGLKKANPEVIYLSICPVYLPGCGDLYSCRTYMIYIPYVFRVRSEPLLCMWQEQRWSQSKALGDAIYNRRKRKHIFIVSWGYTGGTIMVHMSYSDGTLTVQSWYPCLTLMVQLWYTRNILTVH